jgi:hypothetical protein
MAAFFRMMVDIPYLEEVVAWMVDRKQASIIPS